MTLQNGNLMSGKKIFGAWAVVAMSWLGMIPSASAFAANANKSDAQVWVSISDGALSCDDGTGGRKLADSEALLKKAKVAQVLDRKDGSDGKEMRAQMCGIPKGKEHHFLIYKKDLKKAESAGFKEIVGASSSSATSTH